MPEELELRVIETYRDVPIVEVSYPEPTLLTAETHRRQIQAILDYPAPKLAVIISYDNMTCSTHYGAREQAELYGSPEFAELGRKVLCLFRYQVRSLTTLVSTMSAHALIEAGPSNFAPDLESAVRAARRTIDAALEQAGKAELPEETTEDA